MSDALVVRARVAGRRAGRGRRADRGRRRAHRRGHAAGRRAPPDATRLHGLTLPGLANAHSHAFQRALRGRTQRGGGLVLDLARADVRARRRGSIPTPASRLARAAFGEMALAGMTRVGEFHYLHHAPGRRALRRPERDGPRGDRGGRARPGSASRCSTRATCTAASASGGSGASATPTPRPGPSASARWPTARTCASARRSTACARSTPSRPRRWSAWAAARGTPLHAHVSEQPEENEPCLAAHGRTPTGAAAPTPARSSALHRRPRHAPRPTDDVALLGERRRPVLPVPDDRARPRRRHRPGAARWRDAGAALALGSDSQAVIDPFEEARAIELDERLATRRARPSLRGRPAAGRERATGTPASAGRTPAGSSRARLADLVTVGLDGVRLAGTAPETALEAVVFAAGAGDVRDVIVGGRWIVRDGAHVRRRRGARAR